MPSYNEYNAKLIAAGLGQATMTRPGMGDFSHAAEGQMVSEAGLRQILENLGQVQSVTADKITQLEVVLRELLGPFPTPHQDETTSMDINSLREHARIALREQERLTERLDNVLETFRRGVCG